MFDFTEQTHTKTEDSYFKERQMDLNNKTSDNNGKDAILKVCLNKEVKMQCFQIPLSVNCSLDNHI